MTLKLVFAVIAPAFLAVGFDNSEPDCLTVHAVHRDIDFQPGQEASAGLARDLLGRSDVSGGLVVHLGSGDGVLTAALCAGESFIVHGLERDPTEVERSRAWLDSRGLHGQVLIDTWDGYRLPYLDNLVTLIIAEDADDVTEEEMLRVLAPQGTALLKRGVEWTKIVKPRTDAIDEWTHYLGGPDNNAVSDDLLVGPPRHIQWLAAPRWTRHHHTLNSISSVVTADRRLFYIADEASPANINLPSKWTIIARDAFNGVTLWKKPMESWLYHRHGFRSGPAQAPRMLVASADRLYTALTLSGPVSELDAVTGETVKTFNGTTGAEEIILADNTLLVMVGDPEAEHAFTHPTVQQRYGLPNKKSIVAVDRSTGNTLWRWNPAGHPVPETLASDGMNAFVRVGGGVVCLDLESGIERWQYGDMDSEGSSGISSGTNTLVIADGVVAFNSGGDLVSLSVQDGTKLWQGDAGSGFRSPPDILVINDLLWQKMSNRGGPVIPDMEGLDLHTGEVRVIDDIGNQVKSDGHHYRCYRAKATNRFIITGKRGIEMIDLVGEDHSRDNWVRGTCQYGVLPANGLIYAPPHSCGCYMETMLHGFWSLAARQSAIDDPKYKLGEDVRLQTGPAYKHNDHTPTCQADSWPTYRGDPLRRGVAGSDVSARLQQVWQTSLDGRLTQPVIADGHVVLADTENGIVYALDDKSGNLRWKHLAGGRIDSPPTIHRGRVLFGSADGRVTCLRLIDGELDWRFTAAPANLRTVVFDRLESPWPVHGSVLVLEGVAYFSAGRSSWLDGGIYLYGLDPETGQVLYTHHYKSQHPEMYRGKDEAPEIIREQIIQNWTDYKTFEQADQSDAFSMGNGSISDVLVSDGVNVFLHHKKFNAALETQDDLSRHLFSTSSLLDDAENQRSHWFLGTGDFSRLGVAYSWIVYREDGFPSNQYPMKVASPHGVIMVYDDDAIWGVQRFKQRMASTGEYSLFKMGNRPFSPNEQSLPDFRGITEDVASLEYMWREDIDTRVRALVKAGDLLFLAVTPTEIPEGDPHASYEGRRGGAIWVYSQRDGAVISQFQLNSPAVWDGMAAAKGRLYLSTTDGQVLCFAQK